MTHIQMAGQNARTLRWLAIQSIDMVTVMREVYAKHLEIPFGQTNATFESNEELAWVFEQFSAEIGELTAVR